MFVEEILNIYTRKKSAKADFDRCLNELKRMKNHDVYNGFSLYYIFSMRKKIRKLIFLSENEDFVGAFNSNWKCESFLNYGRDLDGVFHAAKQRRDVLLCEEKKLYAIFKDYLPGLVIRKVTCAANEHLFIN